jgi:hypothetical protein
MSLSAERSIFFWLPSSLSAAALLSVRPATVLFPHITACSDGDKATTLEN